jgi:hypothetical protein
MASISQAVGGARRDMSDRWTMLTGIAFTVLFVLGMLVGSDSPDPDAPDAEWTEWFSDGGNRGAQIFSLFMLVLAAVAFTVFITGFVRRLRWDPAANESAANLALYAGLVMAAMIAVGGVAKNQISGAVEFGDMPLPSAEVLRTAEQFGFGVILVAGGLFAAAAVLAASIAARNTSVVPSWLVTAGLVAGVILLFSVLFVPMIVLPLWVLAAAISVGRRSGSYT